MNDPAEALRRLETELLLRFPQHADSLRALFQNQTPTVAEQPVPDGTDQTLNTLRPRSSDHHGVETAGHVGLVTMKASNADQRVIGGYLIESELGRGGMGVVYKARDQKLGRVVALKMILAGSHAGSEDLSRFLGEAQSAARLQHPHIVQVYEIGQHEGLMYFTQEFVAGGSLAGRLRGQPQQPREAARFIELLAQAAEYAHQRGTVHRDLKPANVLLVENEVTALGQCSPKVTDFGLAKTADLSSGLTQSGAVMGTPSYMAPEQAEGRTKEVGPTADIYSLGAILYEMLTGRPPFQAASAAETLLQVISKEPVSVRQYAPVVPADLATICHKCLQKEPARRYARAADLAEDLRRYQVGEPIVARPMGRLERGWRWCRRNPVVASLLATVLVVGLLGAAGITWQWRSAISALERAEREQRERALAQVTALCEANPAAVPTLLAEMSSQRAVILPRLMEIWHDQTQPRHRLRAALAILPHDPALVREELSSAMVRTDHPAELLLIRDRLRPHASTLIAPLWRVAEEGETQNERFHALVALAVFDADDPRWERYGEAVTEQLLSSNPIYLGQWVEALRPVRASLLKPLTRRFTDAKSPETRHAAALVLADYASDSPDLLAEFALKADATQYASLFPVLQAHRSLVQEKIRSELERLPRSWDDPPLSPVWSAPSQEVRAELSQAQGFVEERFALCQSLPWSRLKPVIEALRPSGYRPTRVRPYHEGNDLRMSVLWTRDGVETRLETDLEADGMYDRDVRHRKEGFVAVDLAGFVVDGIDRYVGLWAKGTSGQSSRLSVGAAATSYRDFVTTARTDGFLPIAVHEMKGRNGATLYSSVWRKENNQPERWNLLVDIDQLHVDGVTRAADLVPVDISLLSTRAYPSNRPYWRSVIAQMDTAIKADPRNATLFYQRGTACFEVGQFDRAMEDLTQAIDNSYQASAYGYRSVLRARKGDAEGARADLAKHNERVTTRLWQVVTEAVVRFHLNEVEEAVDLLETARKERIDSAMSSLDLPRAFARGAMIVQAREVCRVTALIANPTYATFSFSQDRISSTRLADRALELVKAGIASNPIALTWLGHADLEGLASHPELRSLVEQKGLDRRHATVWHADPQREAMTLVGLRAKDHLNRARELTSQGWRPAALSLAVLPGEKEPQAVSVWHRPVLPSRDHDRLARTIASGAATALRLGAADAAWPFFRLTPDPTVRSHLIERCHPLGVDPALLIERLNVEKDPSSIRAFLLALGEYGPESLPEKLRKPLIAKLLDWYRHHPDPGIHGATDWLLRHGKEGPVARPLDWGQAAELNRIDNELKRPDADPARNWYVNGQGHTMVVVPGPSEFRMGSPQIDPDRENNEYSHMRRIPRSYSLASKTVTVEQWQRFLKDRPQVSHSFTKRYSPDADSPILYVSWIDAAQYCNWLSEKEGIPKDQWCYPDPLVDGAKPVPNQLQRRGYRLPTSTEWEYACRAGTTTARYHGVSAELMPRYAWYLLNAQDRSWPVGQKRPNDWGLFDMLGNCWVWVQDGPGSFPTMNRGHATLDGEDTNDIKYTLSRLFRGGAFCSHPSFVRATSGLTNSPVARLYDYGLRVARTENKEGS